MGVPFKSIRVSKPKIKTPKTLKRIFNFKYSSNSYFNYCKINNNNMCVKDRKLKLCRQSYERAIQ